MEKRTIVTASAVVFLIMGIAMAVSAFGFGLYYGDPNLLRIVIFGEVVTAIFLILFIRRTSSFAAVGFSELKIRGLVWYLPILLIVLYQVVLVVNALVASYSDLSATTVQLVAIIFVTCLFVGFNEEVLFRGIILRKFHPEQHPYRAIVISAALFSSFHLLNLIAFIPLSAMVFQLGNTFLFGLFFALIALKLNNLWPLILFHALWDFSSIAAEVLNVNLTIPSIVAQVFVALAILIQLLLLKRHDLSHLKRPLTT